MIAFDSTTHTYSIGDKQLISASSLVKKVVPPFDKMKVSSMLSSKRGCTQEEILAEWDKTREQSLARGELVHSYIESILGKENSFLKSSMPECQAFDRAIEFLQNEGSEVSILEKVVYCEKLGVAGRVDCVLSVRQPGDCFPGLVVVDWKTGRYKKSNPFEKLLHPFSDIDNCEHAKASIQTSLYRLMLASQGIDTVDAYIVHLGSDGNYSIIRGIDFRDRITNWLMYGRN